MEHKPNAQQPATHDYNNKINAQQWASHNSHSINTQQPATHDTNKINTGKSAIYDNVKVTLNSRLVLGKNTIAQEPATEKINKINVQQPATHDTSNAGPENPFALSDSIITKMNMKKPATLSYLKGPFSVHDGLNKINVQKPGSYNYLKGSAEGPFSLNDGTKLLRQKPLHLRRDHSPILAVLLLIALAAWFICAFVLLRYSRRVGKIDLIKPDLEIELSNLRRDGRANPPSVYKDEDETPESMV
ncbi:hypothetical protein EDB81DRAFT_753736 [Dactylonectria macrodidyma]|uniref:Uncharacterized protein n=1 Tax=Dactylonectria macrodidyma TaxID=307937 RepID=A0A9P9FT93_9HYPO|nr:hypothetical protein EDB81DRAFT_753736 [Dactylonectria macrodidyma]